MLVPGRVLNAFFDFSIFFFEKLQPSIFSVSLSLPRDSVLLYVVLLLFISFYENPFYRKAAEQKETPFHLWSHLEKKLPQRFTYQTGVPPKKKQKTTTQGKIITCFKVRTVLNLHSFSLVTVFGARFNMNIYIYINTYILKKYVCVYIYIYLTLSVWDLSWTGIGKFHIVVLPTQWNPCLFIEKKSLRLKIVSSDQWRPWLVAL